MLKDGHSEVNEFVHVLGDNKQKINPFFEILKTLFFVQNKHTLPALAYSILEKIPDFNAKKNIKLGVELREELSELLQDDSILIFPSFTVSSFYCCLASLGVNLVDECFNLLLYVNKISNI